ncbi:MAG: hypothetical protein SVK08_07815 [Halobacteriota archaeon]|nr:hypothetical protein [Halobacteriota archaeon]
MRVLKVEVTIDGENIPLNAFVQAMLGGGLVGAIGPLSGVDPDFKNVKISVDR